MKIEIKKKAQLTGHNASIYTLTGYSAPKKFLSSGGDGWIVLWDIDEPDQGRLLASAESNIFSMLFLEDKNWVLAGNMYGGLHWIDLTLQKNFKSVQQHSKGVFAFHRLNAGQLLSLGGEGGLTVWDIDNCRAIETLELSSKSLRCIAAHPHKNILAIGASDAIIYLLDSENLELLRVIKNAHENSVFSLAFSPDGKYLISGGRDAYLRIRLVEKDYEELATQAAHLFTVNDIAFHPEKAIFATASRDKTIKIWDAETFSLLKVVDIIKQGGHLKSVNKLIWANDGKNLISCSDDRSIIIWDFN
jgi:WD40 repeat protein